MKVSTSYDYTFVFIAGIQSWSYFFEGAQQHAIQHFSSRGQTVQTYSLFPYGVMDGMDLPARKKALWKQIAQVRKDYRNGSFGGAYVANEIKKRYQNGGKLVLIGHSGGGVAAVWAAIRLLEETQIEVELIVQIGSPKIIPKRLSHKTAVLKAAGKWGDPITYTKPWSFRSPFLQVKIPYDPKLRGMRLHAGYFNTNRWSLPSQNVTTNLDETMCQIYKWVERTS
ncbi:hypothetical protein [Brevibacillus daliensis]|uniref:hypothetical protein n=1 Tax=Brevibacillus daliensis TaxID=2892995 RepID=UPI001E3FCCD9|nr:hypothetical protein [Brevibacillus daliensis]